MKVLIFGTSQFYEKRRNLIVNNTEIVGFLDNNMKKQGQKFYDKKIYSPGIVGSIDYDIVLLMSVKAEEMKKQLLELGVPREKIWFWNKYYSYYHQNDIKTYINTQNDVGKRRVLILTIQMNYDGGSLAVIYAAKTLMNTGYEVLIMACGGNEVFIKEMYNRGINIMIYPKLPYIIYKDVADKWNFDMAIVNTFPMIQSACEISRYKPVMWWIHESGYIYENVLSEFNYYRDNFFRYSMLICAVSKIAMKNFNYYMKENIEENKLVCGLPDTYIKSGRQIRNKTIFAIIGGINENKSQDKVLNVMMNLNTKYSERMELWIVGKMDESKYCQKIRYMADSIENVQLKGELSRREMQEIYKVIDCVVCASLEETLSLVVIEAMMNKKVSICSDNTGISEFIKNGQNGFIFKTDNSIELEEKMEYVLNASDKELDAIGENARKTYEYNFSMNKFSEKLNEQLGKLGEMN